MTILLGTDKRTGGSRFHCLGGQKAHDSSGRDDNSVRNGQKNWWKPFSLAWVGRRPMTPPVRMTILLGTDKELVEAVFISLGGSKAHDSSGRDGKGSGVTHLGSCYSDGESLESSVAA